MGSIEGSSMSSIEVLLKQLLSDINNPCSFIIILTWPAQLYVIFTEPIIFYVFWLVVEMLTLFACRVSKSISRWADRALIAPVCLEPLLTSTVTVDLKVLEWPPVTRLVCIGTSIGWYWMTLVSGRWHLSVLGDTGQCWVTLVSAG